MESSIQGLLDKIYEDGIVKAEKESAQILADANQEAEKIIAEAEKNAARIREEAKEGARILRESAEADLRNAAAQAVADLKSRIQNQLIKEIVHQKIHESGMDAEFIREMITVITTTWAASGVLPENIEVILPEEMKAKLGEQFLSSAAASLDGIKISSGKLSGGFVIARTDKGYRTDFSEQAMEEFFRSYLKKKSDELLFAG